MPPSHIHVKSVITSVSHILCMGFRMQVQANDRSIFAYKSQFTSTHLFPPTYHWISKCKTHSSLFPQSQKYHVKFYLIKSSNVNILSAHRKSSNWKKASFAVQFHPRETSEKASNECLLLLCVYFGLKWQRFQFICIWNVYIVVDIQGYWIRAELWLVKWFDRNHVCIAVVIILCTSLYCELAAIFQSEFTFRTVLNISLCLFSFWPSFAHWLGLFRRNAIFRFEETFLFSSLFR